MRQLQPPPKADSAAISKAIEAMEQKGQESRQEYLQFIEKANSSYFHWDEFRRRPPPKGFTSQEMWAAVKLSRRVRKPLPLLDTSGQPFTYWLPDNTYEMLHLVDRQGGGLLGATETVPSIFDEMKHRVLIDSLMEEAIATSQIEGAVTTRKVAKDLLRSGRAPKDRSEQMIVNGYQTIRLLRERIHQPLSIELLHDIQASMTRDTLRHPDDAGRLRTDEDRIEVVDERDGETVFVPPKASDLPDRLSQLIAFANADLKVSPFMHPLVRATILHFWLAYEHPYVDGNGRTARALFYWYMLKSGYWLFEFLTISRIILSAPMQYYRSFLYAETDENDLTYFLTAQFDVTRRALAELHGRLKEMQTQQERMNAVRLLAKLNNRQKALIDHALRYPSQIYTIESHQRSHGVSDETARSDLMMLAARGLLIEVGGRRPRQFAPAENLAKRISRR